MQRAWSTGLATLGAAAVFGVCCSAAAVADTYTLDGNAVSQQAALADSSGGGCAASAAPNGEIACFSTDGKREAAVASALRANRVPPGFGGLPTARDRQLLLGQAAASKRHPRAHSAGCGDATHVHNDYYQSGTYGYFYTTYQVWTDFSGTFNNQVSSDTTSTNYHAYYHDGVGGSGHYYDQAANYCHVDNSLAYDAFPDGGTWDNKFSSYMSW